MSKKTVPTEIYSRVVGYFRPVNQWNKGKREEFSERKPYKVETWRAASLKNAASPQNAASLKNAAPQLRPWESLQDAMRRIEQRRAYAAIANLTLEEEEK